MALMGGLEIVMPAHDRRVASRGAGAVEVRAAAARARVVEPTRGAGVIGVIHVGIDAAGQIRTGVDAFEKSHLAIDRPGRARGLVLVPSRYEGGFLQRLQLR